MNVKELIAKLQTCNPEAKVLVYCFEDFNDARSVLKKEENIGDEQLYCKGYSFSEFHQYNSIDYVVIGDGK